MPPESPPSSAAQPFGHGAESTSANIVRLFPAPISSQSMPPAVPDPLHQAAE